MRDRFTANRLLINGAPQSHRRAPHLPEKFRLPHAGLKMQAGLCAVLLFVLFLTSPGQAAEKVTIGFAGGLTGRTSDLGTAGRNGVLLAVEEKNAAGGLLQRPIELITGDDKQDPQVALQVVGQLADQGAIAVIGHMTSAMSLAVKPLIDKRKLLMISPTTSTTALSRQKDFFFRVVESIADEARDLAAFVFEKQHIRSVAVIYDQANTVYTEDFYTHFKEEYEKRGGKISLVQTFTSGKEPPFSDTVTKARAARPEGVFILANAADTAMFCQQIYKSGWKIPRIVSGWGLTEDLPALGGKSVEGVLSLITYDADSKEARSREFVRRFTERFGKKPGFPAFCSYAAAQVLFQAYETAGGDIARLPETIVSVKKFRGLQGNIEIDEFGDAHNQKYLTTITAGQLKVIERPTRMN